MADKGEFIKTASGVCRVASVDRRTGRAEVEYVSGEFRGKRVALSGREIRDITSGYSGGSSGERSIGGGKIRSCPALFWFTGFAVARKSGLWFFVGDSVRDLFLDEWQAVFGSILLMGQRGVTLHSDEHDKQGCQGRVIFKATEQEKIMVDQYVRQISVEGAAGNTRALSVRTGSGKGYWNVNSTALLWFWGREFRLRPPSVLSVEEVKGHVPVHQVAYFAQGVEYGLRS